MIKLATVSPCYNEEEVLRHSVERLTALFERMIAEKLISDDSMMVFVSFMPRISSCVASICHETSAIRMPSWPV